MGSRTRILLYFMVAAIFLIVGITMRLPQLMDDSGSQSSGEVAIGGAFELVDPKGNLVTDKDLLGSYTLINFGYTFCPDVCPTGLQTAAMALDMIPQEKMNKVVSLFITIDPERDTPKVMGEYTKHFHESLIGLSGSTEQVAKAAKAYRVYYKKVAEDGKAADDYLMDHSAFQYLVGPDGKYLTHFPHGISPEDMAKKLEAYIK
ncbi:electron transporter SenC [Terasakiella brassicae]|uniref:Electron transporter SenC n=1 Tax=Terasakiella brassicae TaxID=1634917 RepID=A0A917C270_9PROT|nr:SCO family protein [Terasakiella brassicae]GGF66459.1 electron transporter SenC [Terasakiella brassicae]